MVDILISGSEGKIEAQYHHNNNKNCIFIAYENLDDLKFEKNLCYFLDIKHEKKIKFAIKKKEVFYDFD